MLEAAIREEDAFLEFVAGLKIEVDPIVDTRGGGQTSGPGCSNIGKEPSLKIFKFMGYFWYRSDILGTQSCVLWPQEVIVANILNFIYDCLFA